MVRLIGLLLTIVVLSSSSTLSRPKSIEGPVGTTPCMNLFDDDLDTLGDTSDGDCTKAVAFTSTAGGYSAKAADFVLLGDFTKVIDSTSPCGGDYIHLPVGGDALNSEIASGGIPAGTYYPQALVSFDTTLSARGWVKAGTRGFGGTPDNSEAFQLLGEQPPASWTWARLGKLGSNENWLKGLQAVPHRTIDIATDDNFYFAGQPGIKVAAFFFHTDPNALPDCPTDDGTGEAPVEQYVLKEIGANTPTIDGTLDSFWDQANAVDYQGTNSGNQTTWVTRAAWDDSTNKLYVVHQGTLANLTSGGSAGVEDGGSVLGGSGIKVGVRVFDTTRVRDDKTYTVAINSLNADYTRNDNGGVSNSAYDFPTIEKGTTYSSDILTIELAVELDEDLVADQLLLIEFTANELVSGSPQTSHFSKCTGTTSTPPECWMLARLVSTVMEVPADTAAPTTGNVTVSNVTENTAVAKWSVTDVVSTTFTCRALYDDDDDNEVLVGGHAEVVGSNSIGGVCTVNLTGLPASTAHEVIGRSCDQAGNCDDSDTITDFSTSATAGLTFYIDDNGSDVNPCTTGSRCATVQGVLAKANFTAGVPRTIIAGDGTYGAGKNIKVDAALNPSKFNGTSSAPITLRAENERQATFIMTQGSILPLELDSINWWVFDGLHIVGGDFQSGARANAIANFGTLHNVTVQNCLFQKNNRYSNSNLIAAGDGSTNVRWINNEAYEHSRNGFSPAVSNGLVQGNYVNSRCYADIPGGLQGNPQSPGPPSCGNSTQSGDGGLVFYTAVTENTIIEDNIIEKASGALDVEVFDDKENNLFVGNIVLDSAHGFLEVARGSGSDRSARNHHWEDNLGMNLRSTGFNHRGSKDILNKNNTIHTVSAGPCYSADAASDWPGAGPPYPIDFENILALGCNKSGVVIDLNDIPTGQFTVKNAVSRGSPSYTPSSNSGYTNISSTDPTIGTDRVCIRRSETTLAGQGTDGRDIGANVIYRRVNGQKTTLPRWQNTKPAAAVGCPDSNSGWYPVNLRACKAGANDIAGQSYYDIADRLNISTALLNACAADGSY